MHLPLSHEMKWFFPTLLKGDEMINAGLVLFCLLPHAPV